MRLTANFTRGITTTLSRRQLSSRRDLVDIKSILDKHDVRLTNAEFRRLQQQIDTNRDGLVSRAELAKASKQAVEDRAAREVCLSVIELPDTANRLDRLVGHYFLQACDVGGTILYAIAGTQVAGDVGMNIVGCTLVGCATALGGGTLNNLLYGAASPLKGRPGVFWVQAPKYLLMAAGASLLTFFLWPWYCQEQAKTYLKGMIGKDLEDSGSVKRRDFLRACRNNKDFHAMMKEACGAELTPEQIFDKLDVDKSGSLNREKLRRLTQQQFDSSFETYVMDSLALASFAVAAAHGGIRAGVHPAVAASAGVTICFGGIVRDVLCHRSVAIGAQSYAFATGAGATVYVLMREAAVRGLIPNSLVARILLTAGTTIGLRVVEHDRGRPLLEPMHGRQVSMS